MILRYYNLIFFQLFLDNLSSNFNGDDLIEECHADVLDVEVVEDGTVHGKVLAYNDDNNKPAKGNIKTVTVGRGQNIQFNMNIHQ